MFEKGCGDEHECVHQRRADIGCARGIRAPKSLCRGPDQETEQSASEVSDAARETEQQTNSNCRFNEPCGGNEERGVHRDQTQPHMKPPLQPMRLCVRSVLKVADVMRGK